jgi:CheY-like chemotaxis protein
MKIGTLGFPEDQLKKLEKILTLAKSKTLSLTDYDADKLPDLLLVFADTLSEHPEIATLPDSYRARLILVNKQKPDAEQQAHIKLPFISSRVLRTLEAFDPLPQPAAEKVEEAKAIETAQVETPAATQQQPEAASQAEALSATIETEATATVVPTGKAAVAEAVQTPAEPEPSVAETAAIEPVTDEQIKVEPEVTESPVVEPTPRQQAAAETAEIERVEAEPVVDNATQPTAETAAERHQTPAQGSSSTENKAEKDNPFSKYEAQIEEVRRRQAEIAEQHSDDHYSVLVVDDSHPMQQMLAKELQHMDHPVDIDFADDGETALEKAGQNQYDFIFLDIMMPGIDGFETCTRLRQMSGLKKTPIIMLSSKTSPLDEVKGIMAGSSTYLTKPIDHVEFQKVIKRVSRWVSEFKK